MASASISAGSEGFEIFKPPALLHAGHPPPHGQDDLRWMEPG
jgi:hypothetical protein